ncbi:MAG: CARDB domain-containing protein, partial [Halobacteriota archaeon]|nr:CARDB domain-containing protein [Halobacteriota archaeon]
LPDLTLSTNNISFSNPFPAIGETVTINATIHNVGDVDASNIVVQFFVGDPINGTQIDIDQTISLITAGGNETANVTWIAEAGVYEIYVKIDPENDIVEANEGNNEAHKSIDVGCSKDIIAKKILLTNLNHAWNYDFYEEYYEKYDDNATAPDPVKESVDCTIPTEDDDIWIVHYSLTSPGFYASSAALMGPVIGFDTNSWYNWSTSVNGVTYPEFEIKGIDGWVSVIPYIGEDLKGLLEDLLSAAEFSIKLDGVYADAPLEWDNNTNRSSIPIKFSGKAIGPGLEEGGECGGSFTKYYDIDNTTFGDDLNDLYCTAGIGMSEKSIGYNESVDFDLVGLIDFNGTVFLNGMADPDLDIGIRLKISEPQALLTAGVTDIAAGVNAYAEGEVCALGSCEAVNISLPTPTMENVGLLGEVLVPFKDFEGGDYVNAVFPNPSGRQVRYEDLGEMSPVIRMATSNITINYKVDINLTDFGFIVEDGNICYPVCVFGVCSNICSNLTDLGLSSDGVWTAFNTTINIEGIDDLKWGVCTLVIYSPVDVHLYDSMGRHVGPNATDGIDLEIPNSTYEVNGSIKTVKFPTTTDRFALILNGTDTGTYNMTVHNPILISDVNNTDIIKGITYRVDNIQTNTGNIDYYNINLAEIEKQVNKKVHNGENITDAFNETFGLITSETNITKLPTSLFVSDIYGANGNQVVLQAKLMSLDKALENKTILFKIDGDIVGPTVTKVDGNGTLNYTIPENMEIGTHQISAIYSGDGAYNGTEGWASLNVLNQPPEVKLDLPDFMLSGTFLINGTITDGNLDQIILEIDNATVSDTIPYPWDTTGYFDGLHLIKLTAVDSFGEKDQSIAFVVVDNTLPTISNITATDITSNSTTITWDTDEPSDSLVRYGTEAGNYTLQKHDTENVTSHSVDLTGLAEDTTYYFVVNSTDLSENSNESEEYNFTTEQTIQPYKISLSVGQRRITADGVSNTTITAQLKDKEGNDVNLRSVPINFTTTLGSLSDTNALTDENGTATIKIKSETTGYAIILATSDYVTNPG